MKESTLAPLLVPLLAEHGLELETVDVVPAGKRRLLRIVVDGDGPQGDGPLLDDIAAATKAISLALDESDATGASPYTLEVSSRGIGRPLDKPQHYRRNSGRLVEITPHEGDVVLGRIVSSTDETVLLDVDGTQREVAYADVRKALIQVELNRKSRTDDPDDADEDTDGDADDDTDDELDEDDDDDTEKD